MNNTLHVKQTNDKKHEIKDLLKGYWGNDIWNVKDQHFDSLRPNKWRGVTKVEIDFSIFSKPIRDEVKYLYAHRLQIKAYKLRTLVQQSFIFIYLGEFLNIYYPDIKSIVNIPFEKAILQYRSFLTGKRVFANNDTQKASSIYFVPFRQFYSFFMDFYDTRDEFDKDIWDCRKIPGAKITESGSRYLLNFEEIPHIFRKLVKRYLKFRVTNVSHHPCSTDIRTLSLFLNHIHRTEPDWTDLTLLTRMHMEAYLSWLKGYTEGLKHIHISLLINLRLFIEYIQRVQYPEAPKLPSVMLFFDEDIPKRPVADESSIKYIPEEVLQQLDDNFDYIEGEYRTAVLLLRASGWRISDILNLKYDTCLDNPKPGEWWLCGDIPKTEVVDHRVPIDSHVAAAVQLIIEETKSKSTKDNNPNKLLFVRYEGKRKGRCPNGGTIQEALNRLAKARNIVDFQGGIYHFKNHAFRHTKAVELLNNGMDIFLVQKWLAHLSVEMTQRYAKLLDNTMRKAWEEVTAKGAFRLNIQTPSTNNTGADTINWEYIGSNLIVIRTPYGYCIRSKKINCSAGVNCLKCGSKCTTPDWIPQFEVEISGQKAFIELAKSLGRTDWIECSQETLKKLEEILAVLKEGKIHHPLGKKARENVSEEGRKNGK